MKKFLKGILIILGADFLFKLLGINVSALFGLFVILCIAAALGNVILNSLPDKTAAKIAVILAKVHTKKWCLVTCSEEEGYKLATPWTYVRKFRDKFFSSSSEEA